jgi:hypothetical protein
MDDLAEFIAARLSEDEAMAQAAQQDAVPVGELANQAGPCVTEAGYTHIARHDPARVLREVATKRRLIGRYRAALAARAADYDPPDYDPTLGALHGQMRDEAATWSDHPDYRPEWAPDMGELTARVQRWPDGTRDLHYLAPGETVTLAEWSAHARNAEREARELADMVKLSDHGDYRPEWAPGL